MPLETELLPLAGGIALAFAAAIILTAIMLSLIGLQKQSGDRRKATRKHHRRVVKISGDQLDQLFLYALYFVVFVALAGFIMSAFFFGMQRRLTFSEAIPLILFTITLLYGFLMIVDWSRLRSKRRAQKELREF